MNDAYFSTRITPEELDRWRRLHAEHKATYHEHGMAWARWIKAILWTYLAEREEEKRNGNQTASH